MKRNINKWCAIALCILSIPAVGQVKKNFVINGELKNMTSMPVKIYLNYDAVAKLGTDSSIVKAGKYSFKGSVDASSPGVLTLVKGEAKKPNDPNQYTVMLDNGIINVVSDQTLANATATGSGTGANDEFHNITSYAMRESAEINKIVQSEAYQTSDSLKKAVQQRSTNLLGNALVNMITYVRKSPSSPISPYLTYSLFAIGLVNPEMTDTLNRNLPAAMRKTSIGLAIDSIFNKRKELALEAAAKRKAAENLVPVGAKAKDFTQNDVDGKPVSLAAFKGKYVLIDFWASWCMPCRAENPNVVKAYNTYKDKGFTVLGVSLDVNSQKNKWLEAIKKDGLTWTQLSDLKSPNEVAKLYGVETIPQNFLVDPNGVVVAKNLRGDDLEKKLSEIFK
jgi:peroxiredoxin